MYERTSFDHQVMILGISPDKYKDSVALREWVQRYKDEKYVPPELLRHWGLSEEEAA